jgi:hypothetical protein
LGNASGWRDTIGGGHAHSCARFLEVTARDEPLLVVLGIHAGFLLAFSVGHDARGLAPSAMMWTC